MKQFALTIILIFVITSCKKNYTCECSGGRQQLYTRQIHATKKNAQKSCNSQPAITVYDPERICNIK